MSFEQIGPGDTVIFATPHGTRKGRVVMRSSHGGWVLNLGGKYGTPGIVDESNFISISRHAKRSESDAIKRLGLHRNPMRQGYWTDEIDRDKPHYSVEGRPFGSYSDARAFAESKVRGGRPVVIMQQDDTESTAYPLESVRLSDARRRHGNGYEEASMRSFENPELLVVDNPRRKRRKKGRNPKLRGKIGKKYVTWKQFVKIKMKTVGGRFGGRMRKIARLWRKAAKKHGRDRLICKSIRKRAANRRRRRSRR